VFRVNAEDRFLCWSLQSQASRNDRFQVMFLLFLLLTLLYHSLSESLKCDRPASDGNCLSADKIWLTVISFHRLLPLECGGWKTASRSVAATRLSDLPTVTSVRVWVLLSRR
jgi:hypothetical protein